MNIKNRFAFLKMLSISEGTYGHGDDGYNVIVGGDLFHDYSAHPNKKVWIKSIGKFSTAAGRYQILYRFWVSYQIQLKLPDFGHESQNKIALQLIKECHALDDVDAGRFADAVDKCKSRWASLYGSTYGQHTNSIEFLTKAYINAGGVVA